jgi:hypothetical protein
MTPTVSACRIDRSPVRNEVKPGEFLGIRGASVLGRERVKIRDRALNRGKGIARAVEPDDLAATISEFGNDPTRSIPNPERRALDVRRGPISPSSNANTPPPRATRSGAGRPCRKARRGPRPQRAGRSQARHEPQAPTDKDDRSEVEAASEKAQQRWRLAAPGC